MCRLKLLKALDELVVLAVADLGCGGDVIKMIVMADLLAKGGDFGGRFGHDLDRLTQFGNHKKGTRGTKNIKERKEDWGKENGTRINSFPTYSFPLCAPCVLCGSVIDLIVRVQCAFHPAGAYPQPQAARRAPSCHGADAGLDKGISSARCPYCGTRGFRPGRCRPPRRPLEDARHGYPAPCLRLPRRRFRARSRANAAAFCRPGKTSELPHGEASAHLVRPDQAAASRQPLAPSIANSW